MNLFNEAYAMAQQTQGQQGGNPMQMVIFIGIIFAIFYFLLIRPQKKRQITHQKFIAALQRGEEVITDSGIIGRIHGIADNLITLEIDDNVKIKIVKSRIMAHKKSLEPQNK